MPTFTSYPDPKVVGSVAQDDKGWSWIYNGSAWDSQGFVQQFDPFAGFTLFRSSATDPTTTSTDYRQTMAMRQYGVLTLQGQVLAIPIPMRMMGFLMRKLVVGLCVRIFNSSGTLTSGQVI